MNRVVYECPLGMECEKTVDLQGEKVTKRCCWYIKVVGESPQGGEVDHWGCSMSFMPLLHIETNRNLGGVQASVESLRNESVTSAQMLVTTLQGISNKANKRELEE